MFEKQYDEKLLVEAYMQTRSQNKAAEICGCSRETVARAVRNAGIQMDGRKFWCKGYYGGGSPAKITDAELIEEAKTMTRHQIARKHRMNVCNIDRKLHRLKISCVKAAPSNNGLLGSGKHYKERATSYGVAYDKSVTLKSVIAMDGGICKICGRPVDKTIVNGRLGPMYPSIGHIIPLSKGGGHIWGNVQLAHIICNSLKGDRTEAINA